MNLSASSNSRAADIAASVEAGGSELCIPLSVFFCEEVRRDLEARLQPRRQVPQWSAARPSVDHVGRPVRLVSVVAAPKRKPKDLFDEQFGVDVDLD